MARVGITTPKSTRVDDGVLPKEETSVVKE